MNSVAKKQKYIANKKKEKKNHLRVAVKITPPAALLLSLYLQQFYA